MLHTYFVHPSHIISRFVPTDSTGQQPGSTAISRTRRSARRATMRPLSPPSRSLHFITKLPKLPSFPGDLRYFNFGEGWKKRDGLVLIIFQIKPHKLVNEPTAETRGKKLHVKQSLRQHLLITFCQQGNIRANASPDWAPGNKHKGLVALATVTVTPPTVTQNRKGTPA